MLKFFSTIIPISFALSACSSLLYYPSQQEYYSRKDLPYNIEEMTFPDSQGNQINAWYFHAEHPKAKVLFYHGNAQNLSAHFSMLSWIVDSGYDLMIFDYPGYGKSTGKPTPESTALSGLASIQKIYSINPELPLFMYGQSLGGQVMQKSINLDEKRNYKAVFIEASFVSYRSVARRILAKSWITWLFQPVAWLVMNDSWAGDPSLISPVPVYVLHGDQDGVIPLEQGERVFEQSKEPKQWKVFEGGAHSNSYYIKKGVYRKYLLDVFEKELSK